MRPEELRDEEFPCDDDEELPWDEVLPGVEEVGEELCEELGVDCDEDDCDEDWAPWLLGVCPCEGVALLWATAKLMGSTAATAVLISRCRVFICNSFCEWEGIHGYRGKSRAMCRRRPARRPSAGQPLARGAALQNRVQAPAHCVPASYRG